MKGVSEGDGSSVGDALADVWKADLNTGVTEPV